MLEMELETFDTANRVIIIFEISLVLKVQQLNKVHNSVNIGISN